MRYCHILSEQLEKYNVTQKDLASYVGCNAKAISKYANGHSEPRMDRKRKIEEYFDMIRVYRTVSKNCCDNLQYYLNKYDIMQRELAEVIGTNAPMISCYVSGKHKPRKTMKNKINAFFYELENKNRKKKNMRCDSVDGAERLVVCDKEIIDCYSKENQSIKHDKGKPQLSLVPAQIIFDIAQVREYGLEKYGGSESWKDVDPKRYVDALYRHLLAVVEDPHSKDKESGIEHYKHVACNVAFLCELLKGGKEDYGNKISAIQTV